MPTIRTRRGHCALPALLIACAAPAASADQLIASFGYSSAASVNGPMEWTPFLSYGIPGEPGSITMTMAAGQAMSPLAIAQGLTFELAGDLAAFNTLASNGVNDPMHIGIATTGASHIAAATEQSLLQSPGAVLHVPGLGLPDFSGWTLTHIYIQGSSFTFGPGALDFTTTTEYYFFGDPIPAPASAGALLFTVAISALRRRR